MRETRMIQEKHYGKYGTFFEFRDDRDEIAPPELSRRPLTSKGDPVPGQPLRDDGWSGTLYLELANRPTWR